MSRPDLDELATLEPPADLPDDARITVTAADLRGLVGLIPAARSAREHICAKGDGTHMTAEQIAELHDAVSDASAWEAASW